MTREQLIAFERDVANRFNRAEIRAPVHLAGGNEDQLIDIFRSVHRRDYVLGTWRAHYHCLLHGVPPETLMEEIVAGRSISLCFPEHRIFCSAIVAGHLPIAVGIAHSIKARGGRQHVWAFLGDMAAATGIFSECSRYAAGHQLPITFVVEDNSLSVGTPTAEVWGGEWGGEPGTEHMIRRYGYQLPWPHSGAGVRVEF